MVGLEKLDTFLVGGVVTFSGAYVKLREGTSDELDSMRCPKIDPEA